MTRTMCDMLLLNSVATNYPTTYKGESVIEILEILFTEHEAQLNAKDKEIEKYKSLHNLAKGGLNKASDYTRLLEKQLKAKDEKIKKLKIDLQDYIDQ